MNKLLPPRSPPLSLLSDPGKYEVAKVLFGAYSMGQIRLNFLSNQAIGLGFEDSRADFPTKDPECVAAIQSLATKYKKHGFFPKDVDPIVELGKRAAPTQENVTEYDKLSIMSFCAPVIGPKRFFVNAVKQPTKDENFKATDQQISPFDKEAIDLMYPAKSDRKPSTTSNWGTAQAAAKPTQGSGVNQNARSEKGYQR